MLGTARLVLHSSFRFHAFLAGLFCFAVLWYALHVQVDLGIEPCPLCIFQRLAFIAVALTAGAAVVHNPGRTGTRAYGTVLTLLAALGAGIALRHLWVEHQPPDPFAGCAPSWNYMVDHFPLSHILQLALTGTADCAQVSWTFLGLSMPAWSLMAFVLLGTGLCWSAWRTPKANAGF